MFEVIINKIFVNIRYEYNSQISETISFSATNSHFQYQTVCIFFWITSHLQLILLFAKLKKLQRNGGRRKNEKKNAES